MSRKKNLIHPGEILLEEFLRPKGISQNKLAMEIRVPTPRINAIVHGNRAITADTAIRLAKFFGTSSEFWMNLQTNYDLALAESEISEEVKKIPALV